MAHLNKHGTNRLCRLVRNCSRIKKLRIQARNRTHILIVLQTFDCKWTNKIYFYHVPAVSHLATSDSSTRPSMSLQQRYNILDFTHIHQHSPTLYSKITGEYASLGSKIFPHILLLCSISYSCDNGLTINQHFIKPLQGEKCTSYLSVVDLSIVLPRVFFFTALCGRTNLRLRSRARTPTKLLRSTF